MAKAEEVALPAEVSAVKETPEEAPPTRPLYQEYRVVVQIGGAGDPEVYLPGSSILLDDARAAAHLAAGNIAPLDHTDVPTTAPTVQIVHDAAPKRAKKG